MSVSTKAAITSAIEAHLADISVRGGKLKNWSLDFGEEWTEQPEPHDHGDTTVTVYHHEESE